MPLSEHEQRLLDEIEQALYAEDPKFATAVRSARSHSRRRMSFGLCALGVCAGLALVLVGLLSTLIALSVVGFVLLVASFAYTVQVLRHRAGLRAVRPAAERPTQRPGGIRSRMEDRMRRRFDEN